MVMVDQFIDRTNRRPSTFFGDGIVGHVSFAQPICAPLREILHGAAKEEGITSHPKGTYVCIEGPMFSTVAESRLYRAWGADVIGMTNLQEAKLAREAELCYATLALSTDYDCWHEGHEAVTAEMVMKTLKENNLKAHRVLKRAVPKAAALKENPCAGVLKNAILTNKLLVPEETKKRLKLILGKNL
jgi:5'-methylthioadenosine phosphorylase